VTVAALSLAKKPRAVEIWAIRADAMAAAIGGAVVERSAARADLKDAKADLRAGIEQLKSAMLLWFIGTNLISAAIITAALKL
jgi:hypothetical protein